MGTAHSRRRKALLIHGISSDGSWYSITGKILDPYFEVTPIYYEHYLRMGPLKVAFEPWSLAICGIAMTFLLAMIDVPTKEFIAIFLACLLVSHLLSYVRLYLTIKEVARKTGGKILNRPHVLAHSLGTLLIAWTIRLHVSTFCGRVVLIGSVLPKHWPWERLHHNERVQAVRNEHGRDDFVVWAAGWLGWINPLFGDAGRKGFVSRDKYSAHKVKHPNHICRDCAYPADPAFLHNVDVSGGVHGHFENEAHAVVSWLPFLWAIDPGEYYALKETCSVFVAALDCLDKDLQAQCERALNSPDVWSWTRGKTVRELCAQELEDQQRGRSTSLGDPTHLADLAVLRFMVSIADALHDDVDQKSAINRHPYMALKNAVGAVLEA